MNRSLGAQTHQSNIKELVATKDGRCVAFTSLVSWPQICTWTRPLDYSRGICLVKKLQTALAKRQRRKLRRNCTKATRSRDFPFLYSFLFSCTELLSWAANCSVFSHRQALLPILHAQSAKKLPTRADYCQQCGTHRNNLGKRIMLGMSGPWDLVALDEKLFSHYQISKLSIQNTFQKAYGGTRVLKKTIRGSSNVLGFIGRSHRCLDKHLSQSA